MNIAGGKIKLFSKSPENNNVNILLSSWNQNPLYVRFVAFEPRFARLKCYKIKINTLFKEYLIIIHYPIQSSEFCLFKLKPCYDLTPQRTIGV